MQRYLGSGSVTYPPPNRILEIPYSLTRSPRTGWSLKTQVIYVFEKPIIRYDLKAPALPPGAHRHVPRALWLFAQKQECRHLIGLETGVQVAESHYLAKRYHMMCSSITQLLFDFFSRNSSPTTFRAADKAAEVLASRCMNAASPRRRGPSSRLCLQLTLLQRRAISPYGTAAGSTQFGSRPVPSLE